MSNEGSDSGQDDDGEDGEAEGEFPFLKAEDAAYKRLQNAWQIQLNGANERVTLQLREKKEEYKELGKHREEIGVTLYGAQQQLAKLQQQLDGLHDKYAMIHGKRQEDDEALKQVNASWQQKKRRGC